MEEVMGSDFVGPHEPLGRPKSSLSVRWKALEGLQLWSGMLSLNVFNRSLWLPVDSRPTKGQSRRREGGKGSRVRIHTWDDGGPNQKASSREMPTFWIPKMQPPGFVEKTQLKETSGTKCDTPDVVLRRRGDRVLHFLSQSIFFQQTQKPSRRASQHAEND